MLTPAESANNQLYRKVEAISDSAVQILSLMRIISKRWDMSDTEAQWWSKSPIEAHYWRLADANWT